MLKSKRIILLSILFSIMLLTFIIVSCQMNSNEASEETNVGLSSFVAEMYSADGKNWTSIEEIDYNIINKEMLIKGHFSESIPEGEKIYFYLENIKIELWIKDVEIYQHQRENSFKTMFKVVGTSWESFISQGIDEKDDCLIKLNKLYGELGNAEVRELLQNIEVGDKEDIFMHFLKNDGAYLFFVGILGIISIILFIVFLVLWGIHMSGIRSQIYLSLFLLSCSGWLLFSDKSFVFFSHNPLLNYLAEIYFQYFITFFGITFVKEFTNKWRRTVFTVFQIWTIIFVSAVTVLNMLGKSDFYQFMGIGAISNLVFVIFTLISLFYETIVEKNKGTKFILISCTPIVLGAAVEIYNYITSSVYTASVAFGAGLFGFVILQIYFYAKRMKEQVEKTKDLAKLETELSNNRITMMLSQIHPHFLYNSLSAIRTLCENDPKRAGEMIISFSSFLRGNMDSLTRNERIPFENELKHVKHYLELEQMRFGERLNVEYKIGTIHFTLPTLTLQPIVENAVSHGILRKNEGGHVTIITEETDKDYVIRVLDNGIGYDTNKEYSSDRSHIGIANVKSRIEIQCHGTLEISSVIGEGTSVEIRIPKAKE